MKTTLLYIFISMGLVITMTLMSLEAKAENLVIKNKCAQFLTEADPNFWPCYNESQGALPEYRLSMYKKIKRAARSRGYDLRKVTVVLNDPACNPNICRYKFHAKGRTAYLPIMEGCYDLNMKHGLLALRAASGR